jgi:hypothetical protein
MQSRFGIGAYFHYGTEEREVDTVYLGMWPRQVFARIGLFDEELVRNQDDELNYRLRKLGGRVVLAPTMRSSYQNRQSLARLARQFFEYGEWKVRVLQKHPRQMSWRHFVPPAFVAALLLASAAAVVRLPGADVLASTLTATYGIAVLAVGRRVAADRGLSAWLAVASAFIIMHVAWGSGFLLGLLRHGARWWQGEPPPPALGLKTLRDG